MTDDGLLCRTRQHVQACLDTLSACLEGAPEALVEAARHAMAAIRGGGRVLFCGNGGSAAQAQHLATELVVRLHSDADRRALAGLALTTDTSILTACANDYGFEQVFRRQIEALATPADVLVILTTSGRSPNLVQASEAARARGIPILLFSGPKEGPCDPYATTIVRVPGSNSMRIQEGHLLLGHILCDLIESELTRDAAG